jgi:hypothetical protein
LPCGITRFAKPLGPCKPVTPDVADDCGGPRRGDWEVIGLSDRKVKLRCPFSGREVEWDRFCYLVEEKKGAWPHPD